MCDFDKGGMQMCVRKQKLFNGTFQRFEIYPFWFIAEILIRLYSKYEAITRSWLA